MCRTPGRPGCWRSRSKSIRDALAKHKLTISNINAFMMNAIADPRQPYWHPSWIEPDPHYRAIRREHTKRALQLAARSRRAAHHDRARRPARRRANLGDAAPTIFYDELMPCIEVAEKLSVPLLIEPEPGLLIERFDQYLEFVGRIDSPMIGLNFDIGHAYCVERRSARLGREDAAAHAALPPRRHRRHARASAPRSRPRRDRLPRHARRDSTRPATPAGSPSSSTPTSTTPMPRPAKRKSFSRQAVAGV